MPDDWGGSRKLDVLARRVDLVRRLANSPAHKRDLIDDMDQSRSTIDRAVSELEDVGLVRRGEAGFEATAAGRLALDRFEAFKREFEDISEAEALVEPLGADAPIDTDVVTGGEALLAADPVPYRPLERFHAALEDADRYRAALPALDDPRHVRLLYEHVVTGDRPADVVVPPTLLHRMREEFPRRMAAMAETEGFRLFVGDVPPFALVLLDGDTGAADATAVYVVVFTENGGVHGVLSNGTPSAVRWAEDRYDATRADAEERTDALIADPDGGVQPIDIDGGVAPVATGESLSVALEREGFVGLDVAYFRDEPVADPATAWRAGLTLPEVHTGYAVERTVDEAGFGTRDAYGQAAADVGATGHTADAPAGTGADAGSDYRAEDPSRRQGLTEAITDRLRDGTDCVLVGPPGSGKSTVCKRVACEWYDADRGPVLYRVSGRGRPFESVEDLAVTLDAASGHALVVVEDAVRPEADAVFDAIERLGDREDVSFLLDARESEWRDPQGERSGAADLEVLTMPPLTDRDCERLVERFERTVGDPVDVPVERLREDVREEATASGDGDAPNEVLLLLHRLATYADPLAEDETSLEEAVATVYDDLADQDLALDVCVLANALNAAGIELEAGALYAVADRDAADADARGAYDAVDAAIDRLEGRVLFPRGDGTYRTVHEAWSVAFLDHLIETEGETRAAERFGDCVNALLGLAGDADRRERIAAHLGDPATPTSIADDPGSWADGAVEALYGLGRERPKLAPLFGDGEDDAVELPETCSSSVANRVPVWLGRAFLARGDYDRAERSFERLSGTSADRERDRLLGLARVERNRGNYDDAVAYGEECLSLVEDEDHEARARAHLAVGETRRALGEYDRAREHLEAALEGFEAAGERRGRAETLDSLGRIALGKDEHDRSRECHERSLDIKRSLGDRRGAAKTLNDLGRIALAREEYDRAREHFERSLDIKRAIGDRRGEANALNNIGLTAQGNGEYDRATEYLERSLAISRDLGNPQGESNSLGNLGIIAAIGGEYDRAREYFERDLEITRELGDRRRESMTHANLGRVARRRGEYDRAREHFERSLDIAEEIGAPPGQANALMALARIARRREAYDRAEELLERSGEVVGEAASPALASKRRFERGELARERGEYDRAREDLEAALDVVEGSGNAVDTAEIRLARARLALEDGSPEKARERGEAVHEEFAELGAKHWIPRSRVLLGRVAAADDDVDAAREHFEAAVETFEEIGAPQDALAALERLADLHREDEEALLEVRRRAEGLLDGAPEPVVELHGEWVRRGCSNPESE